jgi:PAS domain S-box-containing protein
MSPQDIDKLVHELRVHQVELKMQNDELRRIQVELEQARDRYRHLYDFAPAAYFSVDQKGAVTQANLTAAALLGLPRATAVGQMFSRFIHRDDQDTWYLHRKALLKTGNLQSFQLRLIESNGAEYFVNLECRLVEDGALNQIRIVAVDISGRRRAEQALQRLNESLERQVAERTRQAEDRAKQLHTLAAELIEAEERERRRIAELLHDDLQQLLAAARMQLEAVPEKPPSEPALSNARLLLNESIGKSRRLAQELSPPVLQQANLRAALQWIVKFYKEQFGLHVELMADEVQTHQSGPLKVFLFRAVQELLFNVVKHAGVKSARVALSGSDGCILVTVSDQGRGLDPGIMDSFSAPLGLGLLSLRERTRFFGGNFTIESSPGTGSRFAIKVPFGIGKTDEMQPLVPIGQPDIPAESDSCLASGATRILFVDDHQVMRQGLIKLVAAQPSITVVGEASNGREAIDQVRLLNPHVVLMDVSMPEMGGIEATGHIKSEWPQVRVIALSMFEDEHVSRAMSEAGAEAFVSKTASSAELLKAIFGIGGRHR